MKRLLYTLPLILLASLGYFVSERNFGADVITETTNTVPSYFAEVDSAGTVLRIIVASQEFIDSGRVGDPTNWIPTDPDGKINKNYPRIGDKYDKTMQAFIEPKPNKNAVLNPETGKWQDKNYVPFDPTLSSTTIK